MRGPSARPAPYTSAGLRKSRVQPGMLAFEHGRLRRPRRFVAVPAPFAFSARRQKAQELQKRSLISQPYHVKSPKYRGYASAWTRLLLPQKNSSVNVYMINTGIKKLKEEHLIKKNLSYENESCEVSSLWSTIVLH